MEEKQAVELFLRTRTEDAFCAFFDSLYARVRRYFLLRGLEVATAEELARDVMFVVYQRAGDVREEALFYGWLFKIAKNELLRYWRREHARSRLAEFEPLGENLVLLQSLPDERRKKLARLTYDYLARSQDAQTGMWAGSVHGLFKFASFAERQGLRFPRADAAYASTLNWLREHEPGVSPKNELGAADTPRLGNPIRVIAILQPDLSRPIPEEDLLMILDWYDKALPRFRQADGAFGRWAEKFSIMPLDRRVAAAPGPQSDINGTSNAHAARLMAYRIVGLKPPPLIGADQFYATLRKRIAAHRSSKK